VCVKRGSYVLVILFGCVSVIKNIVIVFIEKKKIDVQPVDGGHVAGCCCQYTAVSSVALCTWLVFGPIAYF
jgi:hypothetical protein